MALLIKGLVASGDAFEFNVTGATTMTSAK
jgi:hypothetical protein